MKYSTGSCFNFSVAAGIAEVIKIKFGVAGEVDGLNVGNATFRFSYQPDDGDIASATVEHSVDEGCLYLHLPAIGSGEYRYVLDYVDSLGQSGVLLHGCLTAISRVAADELTDKANAAEVRVLEVSAGSLHGGPLELRWAASSVAAKYAQEARDVLKRVENAVESIDGMDQDMLQLLEKVQVFMRSFNEALREAISVVNNYLYVGGVNTGHYLKGEPGVTPHIGLDGYWYVGSERLGDRPAFGADGITPHITPDGYWAFGSEVTNVRAEGRDGLDGTAVRRILVDSYEDIPQSGETCNGGFLYYVPASEERAQRQLSSLSLDASVSNYTLTGGLIFSARRTWLRQGGKLTRLGLMAGSATQNGEPSGELLYAHLFYEMGGVWVYAGRSSNAAAQVVGSVSWWDFEGLDIVPRDSRVKVLLSQVGTEPSDSDIEAVRIQVEQVAATEGSKVGDASYCAWAYWVFDTQELTEWDIYAWTERGDAAGWTRVDTCYDIATAEVYGMTRLATDSVIMGGAPVGVNSAGQMVVPVADAAMPGAVLPSSVSTTSGGGRTHVGEDKKLYVDFSTPSVPGVGKTSYSATVENTATVGLTADNKYAVPPAGAFQWGAVKVGSSVPQTNGMPYIIPMGKAEDGVHNEYGQDITGQLMINTLHGGALRTYTKEGWESVAPNGIDASLVFEGSNAFGLVTSMQFMQSAAVGLELRAATTELLAGVYLASDKDDDRAAAVVSAATLRETDKAVRDWVEENYYTKAQVLTKEEITNTLTSYVLKTTADASYVSRNQLNDLSSDVVHKDDPYIPGYIMTEAEYNALGSEVEANMVYIQV